MHILLIFVCLIGVTATESNGPRQRKWSRVLSASRTSIAVEEIKRSLVVVEQKMQQFCRQHPDSLLQERYGTNHYRFHANLTGCREEGVEVRVGQNLVAVKARDSRCNFYALRLLPDVIDTDSAFWRLEHGQLTIFFPYQKTRAHCGRVINYNFLSLPKFETSIDERDNHDIDVKLGEVGLKKALKRYSQEKDNLDDADY